MSYYLVLFALLFYTATASWLDYKERKIPDWLNALFLLFSLAASFVYERPALFVQVFLFALLFSVMLYRLGAWAGGDAKFFAVLSSLLPLFDPRGLIGVLALFLLSSLLLALYLLLNAFFGRKAFTRTLGVKDLKPGLIPAYSILLVGRKTIPLGFFSRMLLNIKDKSRLAADSLRSSGLSAGEIRVLNAAGVKSLVVREGVVFAPFISLAFLLAVFA